MRVLPVPRAIRSAAPELVEPTGAVDVALLYRAHERALMRWAASGHLDAALSAELASLIRFDLDFTLRHWREPSFDIWEEENGRHYYTQLAQAEALVRGAEWLEEKLDAKRARACRAAADILISSLDDTDFGALVAASSALGFIPKAELSAQRIADVLDGARGPTA